MSVSRRAPSPQAPLDAMRHAFAQAPLVGIGEVHWCARSLDFIIEMIGAPEFDGCCDDIVVEFGNARHQTLIDRYVAGESVDERTLCRVWRDTLHFMLWSPTVYARFFSRLREINRRRPASRRLRVILAEEAFDWQGLTFDAWQRLHLRRDDHYCTVIEREVLARQRRALLVFGSTHLLKRGQPGMISPNGPAVPLGAQLTVRHDDALRVIWPYFCAKGDFLTSTERDCWPIPSLAWLAGSELAERDFVPPFAPRQATGVKAGDLFDGCLYLGPLERRVEIPAPVVEDHAWVDEIAQRLAILGGAQRERIESLLPCAARERIRRRAVL